MEVRHGEDRGVSQALEQVVSGAQVVGVGHEHVRAVCGEPLGVDPAHGNRRVGVDSGADVLGDDGLAL